MKNFIKKLSFGVFFILVLSLTAMVSLAGDAEYKLTISSRSMNVGLDQYTQLKAEVEGLELQPEIEWASSDKSIAVVSGTGIVNGKSLGNFEIIATAVVDGETLTAKFPMKVVKNENFISSYFETNNVLSYEWSYDYCGYYFANDKKSWQESFGFARVYDYLAKYIGFMYDYVRVFFTYEDQDFMVQLWKGQYLVLFGGEIGIYHRDADGLKTDPYTFYNAADEKYWLTMDMGVYHQKQEGDAPEDYELLFKRPVDKYWWCTGFVPGSVRDSSPSDELRIEATLTFKDSTMASLFANGLAEKGFTACDSKEALTLDSYYINGADVSVNWQNINEYTDNWLWKDVGTFIVSVIIYALFKWGLPALAESIMSSM